MLLKLCAPVRNRLSLPIVRRLSGTLRGSRFRCRLSCEYAPGPGAMLTGALVTLWALIECLVSGRQRTGKHFAYLIVLLVMMALGFINALVHAKDGWAAMPAGLWLSVVVTLLALIASWIGYAGLRAREVAHAT